MGHMNKNEQLQALFPGAELTQLVEHQIAAAMKPHYEAFEAAEKAANKEASEAVNTYLAEVPEYQEFLGELASSISTDGYIGLAGRQLPKKVVADIAEIRKAAQEKIKAANMALQEKSAQAAAWRKAVLADLNLCITVHEQREIIAKLTVANPLEAWMIASRLENSVPQTPAAE